MLVIFENSRLTNFMAERIVEGFGNNRVGPCLTIICYILRHNEDLALLINPQNILEPII
jgi:hypothetical protein